MEKIRRFNNGKDTFIKEKFIKFYFSKVEIIISSAVKYVKNKF